MNFIFTPKMLGGRIEIGRFLIGLYFNNSQLCVLRFQLFSDHEAGFFVYIFEFALLCFSFEIGLNRT